MLSYILIIVTVLRIHVMLFIRFLIADLKQPCEVNKADDYYYYPKLHMRKRRLRMASDSPTQPAAETSLLTQN